MTASLNHFQNNPPSQFWQCPKYECFLKQTNISFLLGIERTRAYLVNTIYVFPLSVQRRRCLRQCSKSKPRTSRSLLRSPSGMEGVANTIIDVIIITITLAIIIAFVQVRTSISSLSQSSLSPVVISITRLSRASGHTLDKNSFSFETGVPTALSTEDFYEDQQKVTNTLAMII